MTQPDDRENVRRMYDLYAGDIYRLAYRMTGSRADAEDVVQDVFLGLATALRRYDERGEIGGWIRKVATRVALMKLRRRSRRHEVDLREDSKSIGHAHEDASIDRIALQRALDRLPAALRAVLILKELEGYSHEEIGEILGIKAGASKVRLHRGREILRQLLRSGS